MNAPRPWLRSRLFWLGLPGLLFLLWAWFIPVQHWALSWARKNTSYVFDYLPGGILFSKNTIDVTEAAKYRGGSFSSGPLGFTHRTRPLDPAEITRFAWRIEWNRNVSRYPDAPYFRTSDLILPFWLIVPLYLAIWLTTLHLWQRRKHRLLENKLTHP